ncbi:MAG: hypothetical protein ACOYD9_08605 [Pyramidobacter sp.]
MKGEGHDVHQDQATPHLRTVRRKREKHLAAMAVLVGAVGGLCPLAPVAEKLRRFPSEKKRRSGLRNRTNAFSVGKAALPGTAAFAFARLCRRKSFPFLSFIVHRLCGCQRPVPKRKSVRRRALIEIGKLRFFGEKIFVLKETWFYE